MNLFVHLALVVVVLLAVLMRKDNRVLRCVAVLFIAVVLGFGSLHALTAYRDIRPPEGVSKEAWIDGCLALQNHFSHAYIPVVVIYGFALVLLAFLPVRTANDKGRISRVEN